MRVVFLNAKAGRAVDVGDILEALAVLPAPRPPRKTAMCALCVEDREVERCIRKGRTVWLCDDCRNPVLALAEMVPDERGHGLLGSANSRDGGHRRGRR